jgi:hypothetical protein
MQVRTLLRRDGLIKGLYAGYGAFLLRDLPFDAIEFWAFDTLNIRLKAFLNRDLNAVEQGVCGALLLPCGCEYELQVLPAERQRVGQEPE